MKQKFFYIWNLVTAALKRAWSWYKSLYRGAPWWKKLATGVLTFILAVVIYCFAVIFNLFWLFGKSPSINDIIHPRTVEASELYSADGKLLGRYFSENRQSVRYDSIAPNFFEALVSTEDERFYDHHGIDYVGLVAAFKDAARGHARGASTITQQLVKNMFRVRTQYSTGLLGYIPGVKILIMKSKEMIIATELEAICSKKEILEMYANTVDFGSNAYGLKTAAKTYFGKLPIDLTPGESAVLVGLLKATSYYNPKINPANSISRRNVVLEKMLQHGYLTRQQCDEYKKAPLELNYSVENAYDGEAVYFRQAIIDEIRRKCPEIDVHSLYTDGLKIYTTLDCTMQHYAEEAVYEHMKNLQEHFEASWSHGNPWVDEHWHEIADFPEKKIKNTDTYKYLEAKFPNQPDSIWAHLNMPHKVHLFDYTGDYCEEHKRLGHDEVMSSMDSIRYTLRFLHTGFVAMEPHTGHVKAYVGDVDFKTWHHDKAAATHQPGSTFKLFVYTNAMKHGATPLSTIKDENIEWNHNGWIWRPKNAGGGCSRAPLPLKTAFAHSVNTVSVKLGKKYGIANVIETAHDMGVKTRLPNNPTITLGSCDVSVQEMVSSYSTVANYGKYIEPVMVTRIVDRDGKEIYRANPTTRQAIDERTSYYMRVLMEAGVQYGTSAGMWHYLGGAGSKISVGGKTGTTNNGVDSWFMFVTPRLVAGAWVGGEYRNIHFRSAAWGQGARSALPIVGKFFQKVLTDPKLAPKYIKKYKPENYDITATIIEEEETFFDGGTRIAYDSLYRDTAYFAGDFDEIDEEFSDEFDDADILGEMEQAQPAPQESAKQPAALPQ